MKTKVRALLNEPYPVPTLTAAEFTQAVIASVGETKWATLNADHLAGEFRQGNISNVAHSSGAGMREAFRRAFDERY